LAQREAEMNNIIMALSGNKVKLGVVKRGDIIAREGSTGCSTGSHLHFEYRLSVGGSTVNPAPYISSGALGKPEVGYPGNVTQPYGVNYLGIYDPKAGHTGIDMADGYGSPIFAAKDGTAYLATDKGCPQYGFGTAQGRGIIINHFDGTQTLYWHIQ
jgi:murein DD-endopeptidase MepM/ murein hydrolase activator NlpD